MAVTAFIKRLEEMDHLDTSETARAVRINSLKGYTLFSLVRSVASQLSSEIKRHYKHGTKKLAEARARGRVGPIVKARDISIWRRNRRLSPDQL